MVRSPESEIPNPGSETDYLSQSAKQQCLGRVSSNGDDVSQQPEASLDQWLPSCGSPSSHPSPGTPSSFSSPVIRRNPSVNSPAHGTEGAEACDGNHTGVDGHTDESGEAVRSPKGELPLSGSVPSGIKTSHVRVSTYRDRPGSWSSDMNQEATCDSQAMAKDDKFNADEPGEKGEILRGKFDRRGATVDAELHRDEYCRSRGERRPSSHGLEVTSSLEVATSQDGGHKPHRLSPTGKEGGLPTQNSVWHTYDAGLEADRGFRGSQGTSSAAIVSSEERAGREVLGVSLRLLGDKCQQQVQAVLQKLRQAQQAEFIRAQERLIAQKDATMMQYELLEIARSEFDGAEIASSHHLIDFDRLMLKLSNQFAKASEERQTFERMLKVAEGFGRLSKEDLSKYYGWPPSPGMEQED